MAGIHTGEDLSVPIQTLIQKHLSPKVILDKIIKKQIINAYFKTTSKTTEAGKLFEHLSPSYFVCTYFRLHKQLWNWAFNGYPLLKGIEFLLNFCSTVHTELRSDWALPWGLRTYLPDKRKNWGQYSWVTSPLRCTEQIYRVLRIW